MTVEGVVKIVYWGFVIIATIVGTMFHYLWLVSKENHKLRIEMEKKVSFDHLEDYFEPMIRRELEKITLIITRIDTAISEPNNGMSTRITRVEEKLNKSK